MRTTLALLATSALYLLAALGSPMDLGGEASQSQYSGSGKLDTPEHSTPRAEDRQGFSKLEEAVTGYLEDQPGPDQLLTIATEGAKQGCAVALAPWLHTEQKRRLGTVIELLGLCPKFLSDPIEREAIRAAFRANSEAIEALLAGGLKGFPSDSDYVDCDSLLGFLAATGLPAVPMLAEIARGQDVSRRQLILENAPLNPALALSLFARLLTEGGPEIKAEIVQILPDLGEVIMRTPREPWQYTPSELATVAQESLPPYLALLSTSDSEVRARVLFLLEQIAPLIPTPMATQLSPLLDSPQPLLKASAEYLLKFCGPDPKDEVPRLLALLDDSRIDVRRDSLRTLAVIGPPETLKAVLLRFEGMLAVKEPESLEAALRLVFEMGTTASDLLPNILPAMKHDRTEVRLAAIEAVKSVGGATPEVVHALAESLKDANTQVRKSAAIRLGEIGPPAREAMPALTRVLEDESSEIRSYAQSALRKINRPDDSH